LPFRVQSSMSTSVSKFPATKHLWHAQVTLVVTCTPIDSSVDLGLRCCITPLGLAVFPIESTKHHPDGEKSPAAAATYYLDAIDWYF
jgi:hypothetical protein